VPAQDRARGDHAMATQAPRQPSDEGCQHRPVSPIHAWSGVGSAEHGDLVTQHQELDVLGRGRASQQRDQPEHLQEDQMQQPQRHGGDHLRPPESAHHRWSTACADFSNPTGLANGQGRLPLGYHWLGSVSEVWRTQGSTPRAAAGLTLLLRSRRAVASARHCAELTQHGQVVPNNPMLRQLPVGHPIDVDMLRREIARFRNR
jgi:hypothetical protein